MTGQPTSSRESDDVLREAVAPAKSATLEPPSPQEIFIQEQRDAIAAWWGDSPSLPVRWREIAAVLLAVVLADLTIYRGHGFAGYAALMAAAPVLLLGGTPHARHGGLAWGIAALSLVLGAAMVWCGVGLQIAVGVILIVACAMCLSGLKPYLPDLLVFSLMTLAAGLVGLRDYRQSAVRLLDAIIPRAAWLKVLLPLLAVLGFGTLFVFANPDVSTAAGDWLERFLSSLWDAIYELVPTWLEVLLWMSVACVSAGLLRPHMRSSLFDGLSSGPRHPVEATESPAEAPLYAAIRNTFVAVIALFAVYLVFEFQTLWFRVFPKGFYYSGYAHEGAAWLTVALGLATLVLSLIFRGQVLRDGRLPRLRRLAWIWSAENLLLALAVYHRLWIYIGFNGMTRMRTVAIYGITCVVVGFVLVVWKMTRGRGFAWLIHRQLWTLCLAIYLYAVTPVDYLVHGYNVRRILAGDPAPSVQISVHPIDSGGILALPPLLQSDNPRIREGICALLAERAVQAEASAGKREREGWSGFQLADRLLYEQLAGIRGDWDDYSNPLMRAAAFARFREYAYQWY